MQEANAHCVGPESAEAGIAPSCQGCPNAALCAAGRGRAAPDPDIPLIRDRLREVWHKVMIVSGKGGVGKSTMAKELAFALGARGLQVGLLDLDICGPSLPRLTGVRAEDAHHSAGGIEPVLIDDNVTMMSMHYLLEDKNEAVLFRGPRKNGVIKMFLKDVIWGELDVLLIDTPPGTSDEHITASNLLQQTDGGVDGVVLVTTPQRVAEADVRREVNFCAKAKLPIIGLVENMSGFVCPHCHNASAVFPVPTETNNGDKHDLSAAEGAGVRLSREFDIPLLGKIPLDPQLMRACEEGVSLTEYMQQQQREQEEAGPCVESRSGGEVASGAAGDNAAACNPSLQAIFAVADQLMRALNLPQQ